MKRSLLNIAMALCIGLFAACSQEEIITSSSGEVETVSIDAQLPQTVGTRALPGAAADHQLRCILEVWDKAEGGGLITRIEKLATEASDGKLQFAFSVAKDVNYQCLLWADFIASDATATSGEGGNTIYADKYFTTTNLKAIDFKATDASLFNNASADAFCAAVDKNGTTSQLSVTLKRPFTKVTLKDATEYINDCENFSVEYETPSGYNIVTGIATTTKAVKAIDLTPTIESKTWFSTFIFASTDQPTLDQPITMMVKKTGVEAPEKKVIKGGQISLDANKENNAEASFSDDEDVKIEVDVDSEFPDPNALKIGQFVNKDGTVVATYSAENTVAVVFASGAKAGDAVANYGEAFAEKKIAGYAMAINSVVRNSLYASETTPETSPGITNADPWNENYKGIVYSKLLIEGLTEHTQMFGAAGAYPKWLTANTNTGTNLSGWYIPSASQALDCLGMIFGYKGTEEIRSVVQNKTFHDAYDSTGKIVCLTRGKGGVNFLTSDVAESATVVAVQLTVPDPPAGNVGVKITNAFSPSLVGAVVMIAPVLTVFKP